MTINLENKYLFYMNVHIKLVFLLIIVLVCTDAPKCDGFNNLFANDSIHFLRRVHH